MQIAQIIVKSRTTKEEIFDYEIPPEILPGIKIGLLVLVPFQRRKIQGIIVGLKKRSNLRLKKIISIIDPTPVVDQYHIQLATWMSRHYLCSLGQTLFENLVSPAVRAIKKIEQPLPANADNFSKRSPKNYLVIADFALRMQFYRDQINQTLRRKQSVIFLVPDIEQIKIIKASLGTSTAILHSQMTKTERWVQWNNIRSGKSKIILGSQSALFAPAQNLGLIILDQEENETYKNDRTPRFQAFEVAKKLAGLERASLIVGSVSPRIETYWSAKTSHFQILRHTPKLEQCTVVDMNSEKKIISLTLEQTISQSLTRNERVLLVHNRKGEGIKYSCSDCGWIDTCARCGLPLVPKGEINSCFRCEKNYSQTRECPQCAGFNLKPLGLGTQRLRQIVQSIYPNIKVTVIEKDASETLSNWQIAIVTAYALKKQLKNLGLVAIIDADSGFHLPDFGSTSRAFSTFYKFLRLGRRKLIQTHSVEHYLIKNLAKLDDKGFLKDELSMRKKENFPPFYRLVRLEFQDSKETVAEEEAQKIYLALKRPSDVKVIISPPFTPFIPKKLDKFRRQIIIKHPASTGLSPDLADKLRTLPRGWIVDVDPFTLL